MAVLYICMFVLFWVGVVALSAMAVDIARDVLVSAQQGNYPSPGVPAPGFGRSGFRSLGVLAPGMLAPLSLALLYDLFTIPSQVRAANARLVSGTQQTSGASLAGSIFGGPDRDEEFAAKADELVARYIAQRSQSAAPTKAAQPAQAGTPTFGRRGR